MGRGVVETQILYGQAGAVGLDPDLQRTSPAGAYNVLPFVERAGWSVIPEGNE